MDAMHEARGEKLPRVLGEGNQDSTFVRGTGVVGCTNHTKGEDSVVCQKKEGDISERIRRGGWGEGARGQEAVP